MNDQQNQVLFLHEDETLDDLRHDFKGSLLKIKTFYNYIEQDLRNSKHTSLNYINELDDGLQNLNLIWENIKSKTSKY